MAEVRVERRLAAIPAADVIGESQRKTRMTFVLQARQRFLISTLIRLSLATTAVALASPEAAMKTAWANDRTQLCSIFLSNPSEMQT